METVQESNLTRLDLVKPDNLSTELSPVSVKKRYRLSPKAYRERMGFLNMIQGGLCGICHKPGIEEQDHIDGNCENESPYNLRGVHKSCNISARNSQLKALADSVNEREIENPDQSTEITLNLEYEPKYRNWLFNRTEKGKPPLWIKQAISAGAEFVGCSVQAARHYLDKATSEEGYYRIEKVTGSGKRTVKIVVRA